MSGGVFILNYSAVRWINAPPRFASLPEPSSTEGQSAQPGIESPVGDDGLLIVRDGLNPRSVDDAGRPAVAADHGVARPLRGRGAEAAARP